MRAVTAWQSKARHVCAQCLQQGPLLPVAGCHSVPLLLSGDGARTCCDGEAARRTQAMQRASMCGEVLQVLQLAAPAAAGGTTSMDQLHHALLLRTPAAPVPRESCRLVHSYT